MGDGNYVFRTLMTKSVPHIIEKIFLSLDYESFKNCFEVCEAWCELLRSESFKKRAKYAYQKEISFDEAKLHDETYRLDIDFYPDFKLSKLDIDQIKRILSPGLVDLDLFNLRVAGVTPLLSAAFWGSRALVQVLLDGGADPDKADENGLTPLYVATQRDNIEVVKLLIECGADINRTDNKGWTPLHVAAFYGKRSIYTMLLDGGADQNMADKVGRTPFSYHRLGWRLGLPCNDISAEADFGTLWPTGTNRINPRRQPRLSSIRESS